MGITQKCNFKESINTQDFKKPLFVNTVFYPYETCVFPYNFQQLRGYCSDFPIVRREVCWKVLFWFPYCSKTSMERHSDWLLFKTTQKLANVPISFLFKLVHGEVFWPLLKTRQWTIGNVSWIVLKMLPSFRRQLFWSRLGYCFIRGVQDLSNGGRYPQNKGHEDLASKEGAHDNQGFFSLCCPVGVG